MASKKEAQATTARKLSPAQDEVLRSAAAQPGGIIAKDSPDRGASGLARTVAALVRQDLLRPMSKANANDNDAAIDQDLRITAAGLQAIGLPDVMVSLAETSEEVFTARTKSELILGLLKRSTGASIAEISAASSWQAHSVRGFLSATVHKKLGLALASERDEAGTRRYRIEG